MGILYSTFFVRGLVTDTHFSSDSDMVGASARSPATIRSAHRSINFLEDRVLGSKRISPTLAPHGELSTSINCLTFDPIELPIEPQELDEPVQCPTAEPSIMEDGKMWKERLSYRLQRRRRVDSFTSPSSREQADHSIELVRVDQRSILSSNTRLGNTPMIYRRSFEHFLLAPHSSPESEVRSRLLDDQSIAAPQVMI